MFKIIISLFIVAQFMFNITCLAQEREINVNGHLLSLGGNERCVKQPVLALNKYLSQYDFRVEEGLGVYDDVRPFSKSYVKKLSSDFVSQGFLWPNGSDSLIAWMDFSGDGVCGFSASIDYGSSRPVTRMFL